MRRAEYFETVRDCWSGQLVVCALGDSADGWWEATGSTAYYMHGAMGFASSFGVGLALALPDEEVWVLNSDGGLAMNLGGLLTEAATQPPNLLHVVLNNHCYQSLRGATLVNADRTDYAGIARAAGIANVSSPSTAEELARQVRSGGGLDGHALVIADVEPRREGDLHALEPAPPLPFEGPEIKYRFGRHVEEKTGRRVFGPRGY
jgi:sulfopyruvate decarboxylase subunit beta